MWVAIGTLFLIYCNHRDGKHRSPTTRKEEITMKNSTPRIARDKKTIYATKSFLIKAGQFGTTEFNTLNDMLKTFPGFKVEEEKIAHNASKEAYGKLNYDVMKTFIEGYETDDTKRKAMLEEYETIKTISKTQRGAYAFVKSWFLKKYGAEFNRRKKELETERREAKEAHLLYTPATAN